MVHGVRLHISRIIPSAFPCRAIARAKAGMKNSGYTNKYRFGSHHAGSKSLRSVQNATACSPEQKVRMSDASASGTITHRIYAPASLPIHQQLHQAPRLNPAGVSSHC